MTHTLHGRWTMGYVAYVTSTPTMRMPMRRTPTLLAAATLAATLTAAPVSLAAPAAPA
ncbi:PA domain protein, partial [Micrococcus luteus]|nr:PA domain protein [Micrococcus luteus]